MFIVSTFNKLCLFTSIDNNHLQQSHLTRDTEINLVILPSKESYLEFISNLSIDSPNSQGIFWLKSNYAFITFKNKKQVAKTAFHEAINALNFSLIGLQPRWINEGLAELFESMHITENAPYVANFNIQKSDNKLPPLDYLGLISSEYQWDTDERSHLYFSSGNFLRYLLDHPEGILIVRNLLQQESKDPCTKLSEDRYIQVIEDNLFYLASSFEDWLAENM